MTVKWSTFMGGYARIVMSSVSQMGHVLSELSPRFLRLCVTDGVTNGSAGNNRRLRLPDATKLPLTPGAPIFTIWNDGYFNADIYTHSGDLVGCLNGHHGSGTVGDRSHVYLMEASTPGGTWKLSNIATCTNHPSTSSYTCTVTGDGGGTTEPGTTGGGTTTGGGITDGPNTDTQITFTSHGRGGSTITFGMHAPLPFPKEPSEIPMPVPQPRRIAEEGI